MASALPSARDLGIVNPQPSLAIATQRGATGLEDEVSRGLGSAASAFGAVAQHLDKAQEEFDQIQAEDRYNQYQEALNKLALDPQAGWKAAKGENVLKPEFIQQTSERFDEERKRLSDSLRTPRAKERFNRLAAAATTKHRAALYEHTAGERVAYETKVFNDTMKLEKDNIWRTFGDDAAFNDALARIRSRTEAFARQNFVGAPEESIKHAVQQAESELWAHRIQAALTAGDSRTAKELMGKATGVITTADREKLLPRIQAQLKVTEAIEKVDQIFAKHVSPDLNAPFPATRVDEELRKAFSDNPEGLQAARAEAAHRRQTIEITQRENNHSNVAGVVQMFYEKRMTLPQIMKTSEYQAMDGDQKAKFIAQVENYNYTQTARAAAAESRAQAAEGRALAREQRAALAAHRKGQEVIGIYMMNPDTVRDMSDNAIRALMPDVGIENTLALLDFKKKMEKPEILIEARIDATSFKAIIAEYGYDPALLASGRKLSEKQKQQRDEMGAIQLEVNQRIQAAANQKRRKLELEEKEQIMRDALKEKVYIDHGWFSTREIPAIAVPATGERATAYRSSAMVPFREIPPESVGASIAFLRANRPELSRLTDAQIADRMKGTIERAAGLARSGASKAEIEAVLGGPNYKPRAQ